MKRYLLPLGIFLAVAAFLAAGLKLNPREVPSPLIGKPAPAFAAAQLGRPEQTLRNADMLGKVWLLNVWASWCAECRNEHLVLTDFARKGGAALVGLNYKDKRDDAVKWLARFGDPYVASLSDPDGRIGIDYGVYGVPETFVIDKAGVIRLKHIGPLTFELMKSKIEPMVKQLNG